MGVNFDCDLFWTADRGALLGALSILPEYLRSAAAASGAAIDYRDWQVPLGRRCRSLKLWFTLRTDGIGASQAMIRRHVELTRELAGWVRDDPRFDQEDVHDVHRMIRAVIDHYPGRIAVGEVRVADEARFARYVRSDELHLGFNSRLLRAPFDATAIRQAIENTMDAVAEVNAPPAWVLCNHDTSRPVTRYGGGAVGAARARAMLLVELALPGAVHLYNGEELGLPDVELPDSVLQDPVWETSGRTERGRDASRVPIPWEGGPPGYGFSTGAPWLPMPPEYGALTVAEQLEDTDSTLSLTRRALELRKTHPGFSGRALEWFGAPDGCLAFRRAGTTLVCALNGSAGSVPLPPGDLLLASGPLTGEQLPPNTAAWLA